MAESLYSMNDAFRKTLKSVSKDENAPVTCDDLSVARASIVIGSAQLNLGILEKSEQQDGIATYSEKHMEEMTKGCVDGCRAIYSAVSSFNTVADHYGNPHIGPRLDMSRTPEEVGDLMRVYLNTPAGQPNYMPEQDNVFANNFLAFARAAGQSILPPDVRDKTEGKTLRERYEAQINYGSNVSVGDGAAEARSIVD